MKHELKAIHVCSSTRASYLCSCGTEGTATMVDHLASKPALEKRAKYNHSMHRVRALIREGH